MTIRNSRRAVAIALIALATLVPRPAYAILHFMQIEKVISGVDGDATAQAIQLRMRSSFQNLLQFGMLVVWDATGANPVLLIDFQTDVVNEGVGVTVLITSGTLAALASPPAIADYTMANLIPVSYLAAGSLTFQDDISGDVWWRLSWGGANYTGPTTGTIDNDIDGDFGTPVPNALSTSGVEALVFQGAAIDPSTTNAADYAISTDGTELLTNNAGDTFDVVSTVVTAPEYPELKDRLFLGSSVPNPFNPATRLSYSIPSSAHVRLTVHDAAGRLVSTLVDGLEAAGEHTVRWSAHDVRGLPLSSGIYYTRLESAGEVRSGKITLSK